jgi:sterol desaturase/sphingolipid hydroxylase (fatty acid hydroxylase superfamily)
VGDWFATLQQALFEGVIQPLMLWLDLAGLLEIGYAATGWLLVGLLQIALMLVVFRTLERWRPVEPVADRAAVRVDIAYTLLHRLGLFRVLLFFTLDPMWDALVAQLRLWGLPTFALDDVWPGVSDVPLVAFVVYLVLFDFVDYWLHRGQHTVRWWWSLHALHHSQRQMTMWSDNRNHLLDDALRDSIFVLLALLVGVPPSQFVAIVACTQLLESLAHANVRLSFGPWFSRVLVGPRFHRLHHAIGLGHEGRGPGTLGGHNYAVLFPVWDLLFGTARFDDPLQPTGIRDQLEGRDYGRGFWAQQWLGLLRLSGRA